MGFALLRGDMKVRGLENNGDFGDTLRYLDSSRMVDVYIWFCDSGLLEIKLIFKIFRGQAPLSRVMMMQIVTSQE